MADEVKLRTPAPQPLPHDEAFTPGGVPVAYARSRPEDEFWENLIYEEQRLQNSALSWSRPGDGE